MTKVRHVAELDIGVATSAIVTDAFYRELLRETLDAGLQVLLLRREVAFTGDGAPPSERVDLKQGSRTCKFAKLYKRARKGFRMAIALPDFETGIKILTSKGYQYAAYRSTGSSTIIRNWSTWLVKHSGGEGAVLVFGHDFEPAFVYEVTETDET